MRLVSVTFWVSFSELGFGGELGCWGWAVGRRSGLDSVVWGTVIWGTVVWKVVWDVVF